MSTPRPSYSFDGLHRHLAAGRNKTQRPTDVHCLRVYLDTRTNEPVVCMHSTPIATFHENGTITVKVGGWGDSSTTRDRIGEVTGLRISTIAQHKKRAVTETSRAYAGYAFPYGVPFEDGIVVRNGCVVYHPAMKRQGCALSEVTEQKIVVDKDVDAHYRELRRAMLKRFKPMVHFVSEENLPRAGRNPTSQLYDLLTSPPADEDLMDALYGLMSYGVTTPRNYRSKPPKFDPYEVLKKAMTVCAGPSSWNILDELGGLVATKVKSREI